MNKLITLFLLVVFSTLQALSYDNKAAINVTAQTVIIDEPFGLSVYTGNAKLTQGSLVLNAEEIQIFSLEKTVNKIIAKGSKEKPARYKQNQLNQPNFIEASAMTISYFIDKQFVQLEDSAYLIQGFDTFSSDILYYDIKKDKMIAKPFENSTKDVKFKIKL